MKCVHCSYDARYKDRSNGCCPKCGRRFAFDPMKGDPMTDGMFAAAVARVSSDDRVRFHPDHVYYDVRRRLRRGLTASIAGGSSLAALPMLFACLVALVQRTYVIPSLVIVVLGSWYGLWLAFSPKLRDKRCLSRERFDGYWSRYLAAHGAPKTLIEPQAERARPLPAASADEMLSYSFDRAVICDRSTTVDLLIANQFHFENNCAVLSIDGYPRHAFETVRAMLRNNPRLIVLALHDASIEGCKLAYRLQHDSAWFKDRARVVDVGLRPAHAKSFPNQEDKLSPERPVSAGAGIDAEEARWLSRFTLSLAVVTPEQVVKRLFRAVTVAEDDQQKSDGSGGSSGGDGSCGASYSFSHDADASDGGGDSFG